MAHHACGVIKARLHVAAGKPRIFPQDVLNGIAGGKKFQDGLHRDPRTPDNGLAVAYIRMDGDSAAHASYISY